MEKKILIYSDCHVFSGSENLIPFLLNNKFLKKKIQFFFLYKKNNNYEKILKKKIDIKKKNIWALTFRHEKFIFNNYFLNKFFYYFEFFFNILDGMLIYKEIKKLKPDQIFINNGGYPGARTCKSFALTSVIYNILNKKTKITMYVNNIARGYDSIKRIIDLPFDKVINLRINNFFVASNFTKKVLSERVSINKNKIKVFPNTFEIKKILKNKTKIKKSIKGLKNKNFVFGVVGELSKRKGIDVLFETIIKNREKYLKSKLFFLIIGEGNLKNFIIDKINKHKLYGLIKLLSYKKNIFDYYNMFDCLIHCSNQDDDFPFVIREAMSMKLPILASKFGGNPELVKNNFNGFLFKKNSISSLDFLINKIISNRKNIKKFSKNSFKIYNKKFNNKIITIKYYQYLS